MNVVEKQRPFEILCTIQSKAPRQTIKHTLLFRGCSIKHQAECTIEQSEYFPLEGQKAMYITNKADY